MLQKATTWQVLTVFFDEPLTTQYLKEMSRRLTLAHTSVKRELIQLCKEQFIVEHIKKRGSRMFPEYLANRNEQFLFYKKIHNLIQLHECGLINYLRDTLTPTSIVLFGSFMRGEDTEKSDIDLFINAKEVSLDLSKFSKLLSKNIQCHFKEKLSDYPLELAKNILNGIVLYGYLDESPYHGGSSKSSGAAKNG
jgi:predicted nucleotidyltransferase